MRGVNDVDNFILLVHKCRAQTDQSYSREVRDDSRDFYNRNKITGGTEQMIDRDKGIRKTTKGITTTTVDQVTVGALIVTE